MDTRRKSEWFALFFGAVSQLFPASHTATFGSQVVLMAAPSSGFAPKSYEWSKDGSVLIDGQTLTVHAMGPANAGVYTVTASDDTGGVTSPPFTLTLDLKPVIASASLTWLVARQSTVYLTITLGFGSGVTYKWKKNGKYISGATSSTLVLRNVKPNDAGLYRGEAHNAHGMDFREGTVTVLR